MVLRRQMAGPFMIGPPLDGGGGGSHNQLLEIITLVELFAKHAE
ncbi:hypothetical protein [Aeromonas media]|nr:hypothetical protein [Aeromonas media]